jgi:Uma2 family endonuclease
MATQASQARPSATSLPDDLSLPLYRLDTGTYDRLVEAGALDGIDVELREGLLVERGRNGRDPIHRLDTETYNRMVETGALAREPVELLDGLLVEMSPQGESHIIAIMRLTRHFRTAEAWLMVQLPLEAKPSSEPEPDLALVHEERPTSSQRPREALLTVEVAVTSHKKDRGKKAQLYAQNGVPTYWLVDVPGRTVEVRIHPGPKGYGHCEVYGIGVSVPSPAEGVPDLEVATLFDGLAD